MATYDSTVRLRQLNKPELSGYIVEVIGQIPNTGNLTGAFYPLGFNPSGYISSGQTGNFVTQTDLDSNYYNTLIYVGNNYYPSNNPSGYLSSLPSSVVYNTGNQNISGLKNFYTRPQVSGIGILLSGEISGANLGDGFGLYSGTTNNSLKFKSLKGGSGINVVENSDTITFSVTGISGGDIIIPELQNVVYTTGNQTISGIKSFSGQVTSNIFLSPNLFLVSDGGIGFTDPIFSIAPLSYDNGTKFTLRGNLNAKIELYNNSYITGFSGIYATNIYKSGYPVINSNETGNFLTQAINTGIGSGILSGKSGDRLIFKSLRGGSGIRITGDSQNLILEVTGISGGSASLSNPQDFVYVTGSQSISGYKTFLSGANFQSGLLFSGVQVLTGFNSGQYATTGNLFLTGSGLQSQIDSIKTWTGNSTGLFYPRNQNPSGYLTSAVKTLSVNAYNLTGDIVLSGAGGVSIKTGDPFKIIISGGTGGFGGSINYGANLGIGSGIYSSVDGDTLKFKSLVPGSGIRITGNSNQLFLEVTGIVGGGSSSSLQDVVFTTGNQSISGEKIFLNKVGVTTGSLRGVFDVSNKSTYTLPNLTSSDVLNFNYGEGQCSAYGAYLSYYVYGYKDIEGQRIYSNPVQFSGFDDDSSFSYYLTFSWDTNPIYDGYYLLVDEDPFYGVTNGYSNPSYGKVILNIDNSLEISRNDNVGNITYYGYYDSVGEIGSPNTFSKLLESDFYIDTGLNHKISLKSKSIEVSGDLLLVGSILNRESNTITNSNIIGLNSFNNSYNLVNSNLIGLDVAISSDTISYSNLIGFQAGRYSKNFLNSNFLGHAAGGESSGNQYSNAIGYLADFSSINSQFNNSLGFSAGQQTSGINNSNFIGREAGYKLHDSSYVTFIGYRAGALNSGISNSILIGNYTSGYSNSIAIGQGVANSTGRQLNIGNVLYATNIDNGNSPSSIPISNGKVGILIPNPQYTLDVSGSCRITGQTIFAIRPTVNGTGVLLSGEATQGISSSGNVLSEKYGYGAGIYTFSKTINANSSGNIFGIFDSKSGCQIFDVMINAEYPVAKKYSVVHQRGQNPISYLNVNSGPSGSNDFNVSFFSSGVSGVAMNIGNSGITSTFLTTLFLGGSVYSVNVTGY